MSNNKPTIGTLFSGGGVCLANLKDTFDIAFGVEYSAELAEVYKTNISPNIIVSRVQDVDISKLSKVDVLQASPVCKEFSAAKVGGKEGAEEISQAQAVVGILKALTPPVFILENVRAYMGSQSYQKIVLALLKMGYTIDQKVLNSANYGVPQTRERLILRAVRDRPMPYLPDATPWQGWYSAIEDLIPTLPEDQFAEWQLKRLPENFDSSFAINWTSSTISQVDEPFTTITSSFHSKTSMPNAFLMRPDNAGQEWGKGYREAQEPCASLSGSSGGMKGFLVDQNYGNSNTEETRKLSIRQSNEPAFTMVTNANRLNIRAWLSQGRVVRMSPRALARFQSLPDTYQLPDKASVACTVIGNGWPSDMARRIIQPLVA